MEDLIDWLRACIARDRTEAEAGTSDNSPSAVLAQCEAHERLLNDCAGYIADGWSSVTDGLAGRALSYLGLAYQHHRGYRDEWRPWASA